MTWFSLPAVRKDHPPAFVDMNGCAAWLSAQPLANAPLMQDMLAVQIEALNGWAIAPRERFKILETLRKPVFAIEGESSKRYEARPLPLSAVEQKVFDASCRLWRQLAIGYLHCLRACLDQDSSLGEHHAKIAHRVLTCLRLEQLARYRACAAIPASWWRLLHATLASADQLRVTDIAVSDRLFAETRESSPRGQYAMALLLHLARPGELSRSQFAAVTRWLARWREQVEIFPSAEAATDARSIVIELASDQPVHTGRGVPANGRWLAIDSVLGKCKNRIKGLREGQTPEELRLGSNLTAETCIGLLQFLHGALQSPPAPSPASDDAYTEVQLATSVERIHQLLGGKPVNTPEEPTARSNRALHERIAVFGHAARDEAPTAGNDLEDWQLLLDQNGLLVLRRPAGGQGGRLGNRSLVAIRTGPGEASSDIRLAIFRSLTVQEDGSLLVSAKVLPGRCEAMIVSGRERVTNRTLLHPALFLPATGLTGGPASLFIPAGATTKLIRLEASDLPDGLKIGSPMDRGTNYERLGCE